jgi:hypothetical protein
MSDSYELTQLDPNTFEHLVNLLAIRVLGAGSTGFGPGSDGGRDGFFEGEAHYPSETERWSGCWYIQSKFHKPHLSKDPQKWLIEQIKKEIKEFQNPDSRRQWPDNWIIATNIDPSGTPDTGAFDQARQLVKKACPKLDKHFHIWGGRKILDFLVLHPEIGNHYRHFLTPGKILTEIYNQIRDAQAEVKTILRFLVLSQFDEQQHTKLEQAAPPGSTIDRFGIHDLFIDLPFRSKEHAFEGLVMESLVSTAAKCHRFDEEQPDTDKWRLWNSHPSRAKVCFIKGGPGQGKSTISQYFCQIQRAALVLQKDSLWPRALTKYKTLAAKVQKVADQSGLWPSKPRIPISIELKEFAQWFGRRDRSIPCGILTYLAEWLTIKVEEKVSSGTLKRMMESHSWVVIFDGLDEVPQDVKDSVALEVCRFIDDITSDANADLLSICTSRPQGYSGQFTELDGPTIELINLSSKQALDCAKPILGLDRTQSEAKKAFQILESAIESPAVRELMTTPLQSHIMAIVVRDGERPPERKWKLFTNFYQVIKRREANRDLPNKRLAKLLREQDQLLKTVHNRLGFALHARAEISQGAQTKLNRDEFKKLVTDAVEQMVETEVKETIKVLMEATSERLVLVNTPDDGHHVRFDIRPLQEFFAAQFIYESVSAEQLRQRISLIAGDAHWREVMHFLLSALVENDRKTELTVAVQVLENLNEGEENCFRLLNRRLGRGAILAARLLQEGVLDEDKRIRQQFRKCLEPLAGSIEMELLQNLNDTTRSDSQSWLYEFLISLLHENKPTESIGAAIVLAQILPDDHSKTNEVSNLFLDSPPEYLSYILASNSGLQELATGRKTVQFKRWFLKVILTVALDSKWHALTEEAFTSLLKILVFHRAEIENIVQELKFSKSQISLFEIFIEGINYRREFKDTIKKTYDSISIIYSQPKWIDKIEELDPLFGEEDYPGILKSFATIVKFVQSKNKYYLQLLNSLEPEESQSVKRLLFHLKISSEENLENPKILPILGIEIFRARKFDLNSWKIFLKDHFNLAIRIWASFHDDDDDHTINTFSHKDAQNIFFSECFMFPEKLQNHPHLWGFLLNKYSGHENELRQLFLMNSSRVKTKDIGFFLDFNFYSFKLNLPLEALLLPHLIDALLRNSDEFEAKDSRLLKYLSTKIIEMAEDVLALRSIVDDPNQDQVTRAAAALALLLHPNKGISYLGGIKVRLVEFYNSEVGLWYVSAITLCLRLLTNENSPDARWIIHGLLESSRTDYEARRHIQRLLAHWRESSHAPVQEAKVPEQWLLGG